MNKVTSKHRVSKLVRKSKLPDTDLDEANILKWSDQPQIYMPGDKDSPIPDAPPDNSEGEIMSEAESEQMDNTEAPLVNAVNFLWFLFFYISLCCKM